MTTPTWIDGFLRAEKLPAEYRDTIADVHRPLAERIATKAKERNGVILTVGVCGPQGSGKSTMVLSLKALLELYGLTVAILSLDDLYLGRAERIALSHQVHPLFKTRGVPGTHDTSLALRILSRLPRATPTLLPSFDKARDDRRPIEQWSSLKGPVHVLLFEGWCVGARPQSNEALIAPVNSLERDEDSGGVWRRHVNVILAGEYQVLFSLIDMLVLLKAPSFEAVCGWRLEQERKLQNRLTEEGGDLSRSMSEMQLAWFVSHFQRLTCHILEEMPARADVVLEVRHRCWN